MPTEISPIRANKSCPPLRSVIPVRYGGRTLLLLWLLLTLLRGAGRSSAEVPDKQKSVADSVPGSRLPLPAQNGASPHVSLWQQWRTVRGTWHSTPDRMQGEMDGTTRGFAIAEDSRYGIAQTIEIALTPQKHVDASWSVGGLCLYQDAADYWRLGIVESPDNKDRYAELQVMHGGSGDIQATLRPVKEIGKGFTWTWNQTYRLRLTSRGDEITGEVLSLQGKSLWSVTYALADANLLPSGRPALNVQGMQATFAQSRQELHPDDIVNCRMLKETNPRTPWLALPDSRLTLFPTFSAAHSLPDTHLPAFPLHAAYYVGEYPEQFPFLWAWQPMRNPQDSSMTSGPRAAFTPEHTGEWQTDRTAVALSGKELRVTVTDPPFGMAVTSVTADLDRTPLLLVRVAATTGAFAVQVSATGQASDTVNLQVETKKAGSYCYDLRRITGWHGKKTFQLKLLGLLRGTVTTYSDLRFIGAGSPLPDFTLDKTEWQPHQLTQFAHAADLHLRTETGFADENTIVQLATVEKASGPTPLLLMGQFFNGSVLWNEAQGTVQLQGPNFHGAIAVGRRARWLGLYPSWADWLVGHPDPNATSGIWALEVDGLREGDTVALTARFAPTAAGMHATARTAAALAAPEIIHEAFQTQETSWNLRLSQVPHPLDFQLHLLPNQGVTSTRMRQTYYKAWVFLLANILPPQPENGYTYPQFQIAKPSLWEEGAPHARGSSQWESLHSAQFLAWMMPDTAWEAFLGQLSLARADGVIEGEGLPAQFAQTAWALYRLTGDKARLRQAYPALKRVALWKIREPRWLYYNSTPADMKIGEYMQSALQDMVALSQIAEVLSLPNEIAYWKAQKAQWGAQYRQWFWESPSGPAYTYFYTKTGKRVEQVRFSGSSGWGLPDDILPPASRAFLVTLYLKTSSTSLPFLIQDNTGYLRYNVVLATLWQDGRRQETMQLAESAMREITTAGEFSEGYGQERFPPVPGGVIPEASGAMQLLFGAFWHNGVDLNEGMPRCLPLGYTSGILNLHINGKRADIRIDTDAKRLELAGEGVKSLRLPDGLSSGVLLDGLPVLRGTLPAEGLRLHHVP